MFFINHTELGDGSTAIIEFDGPLNSESAPDFDDYINRLIDKGIIYLLLDMQNLKFISSEGIGATLMMQKSIETGKGIAVFFNLNSEIALLFKLLGFDRVFTIVSDRSEALAVIDRRLELFPENVRVADSADSSDFDIQYDDEDLLEPDTSEPVKTEVVRESTEAVLYEPFVIECVKCSSLIRIHEPGEHICPYCDSEFTVNDQKKAIFRISSDRE